MNTKLNDRFVKVATRLFEKLTQTAVYNSITTGEIDFTTGKPSITIENINIYCRKSNPTVGDLTNGLAEVTDLVILTAGSYLKDNAPKEDDTVTIQEKTYTVKKVIEVDSVYDVAYYKLFCGKA